MQSADVIFNPNTTRQVRLMLAPREGQGDRGRSWTEQRVPRKGPKSAALEGTLEWLSWHSGDGHGRVVEVGTLPPVAAGGTADTRYQYMALLPPRQHVISATNAVRFIFEHAGYIWAVGQEGSTWTLYKIDPDADAVVTTFSLGTAGAPVSAVTFDDQVYFGMGLTTNVYRLNAAGTAVTQGTGDVKWQYAAVVGSKLYFNTTVNVVRNVASGADPFVTGNWSGVITTGDSIPITSLSGLTRVLYIGREDGLNGLDTDLNLVNLLPEIKQYRHEDNLRNVIPWHGALLVQHQRGLFYFTEGLVQMVGPERYKTNTTMLQGYFHGLVADGEWVWGLIHGPHDGDDHRYFLVAGRERTGQEAGEGPMAWCVLGEWTVTTDTYPALGMVVSTLAEDARLWFTDPETLGASYIVLPDLNAPPREPGVLGDFASSATLTLPVVNMGQALVDKYVKSVEVDVANAGSGQTVTVWYAANPTSAEPAWTQIPGTIQSTGRTELLVPDDVMVREVQLQLRLATTSSLSSPVVHRVALNYVERAEKATVATLSAIAGAGVQGRNGGELQASGVDVRDRLYAMEDAGPQTLIDPWGRRGTWLVHDVQVAEAENKEEPHQPLLQIQCTLQRVT